MMPFNNMLMFGGAFSTTPGSGFAQWDGTSWKNLYPGGGTVRAFVVHGGDLYAGGDFAFGDIQRVGKIVFSGG